MEKLLDEIWLLRHPYDALFLSIIEGYEIKKSEDYPDDIFYMKGDKVLIEYDLKTKYSCVSYNLISSVFKSKFSLNYDEIRELLRDMLESHLKLKGITPLSICSCSFSLLESHLKLKGTTL